MVLLPQQFAEIINYLRNRASAAPGAEKRRTTRMELRSKLVCIPITDGTPGQRFSLLTRDISMEGLGLLTAVPVKQGQHFIALLPRNEAETVFVLCEVMHCGVLADGLFSLGCRFVKLLEKTDKIDGPGMHDAKRMKQPVST